MDGTIGTAEWGAKGDSVLIIERRLSSLSWNYAQRGLTLDRKDRHIATVMVLRPPFYSQCYVAAPFAFVMGLGFDFVFMPNQRGDSIGLATIAAATLWYGLVQVRWFKQDLSISAVKAIAAFVMSFIMTTVAAGALTLVIGLEGKSWDV